MTDPRAVRRRFVAGPSLRLAAALGLGLGLAALFWAAFSAPYPLAEYCTRRPRDWILPLFERPRHSGVGGQAFLLIMAAASLAYLAAVRLAGGRPVDSRLRGRAAAVVLLGVVPLALMLALLPGYPLLSGDVFKYILDGRILAVYGQNPFLHVPAEFSRDPFYETILWRSHVNAHGPIWRVAEAVSAAAGGDECGSAVLAMKAWPSLAYLGTIAAVFAMLRAWQPDRAISGTMVYAWNPLVVLEALQSGHNDGVAALPALGAVWLAVRGRFGAAFPLLAVAALIKPLALALGPLVLVAALRHKDGRRAAPRGIALGAALIGIAYLPFWAGPATLQGLARGHLFASSPARLVEDGLRTAGLTGGSAQALAGVLANGLFLLLLVVLLRAVWQGRLPLLAASVGVYFLYVLVGAQWFNPWYLLWMAPLAALVPEGPPRALGIGFTLLAPLVYPLDHQALPIVLLVFVPMAILAVWWRRWLGWPDPRGRLDAASGRRGRHVAAGR